MEAEGRDVEGDGVLGGVEEACEACAGASEEIVIVDGLEDLAGSDGAGTLFADSSRTCSKILDVSGITGGFGVVFEGAGAGGFDSALGDGEAGGTGGLETVFATGGAFSAGLDAAGVTGVFFVAVGIGFTGIGAAFVDFALVVDFFVSSGISTSMG